MFTYLSPFEIGDFMDDVRQLAKVFEDCSSELSDEENKTVSMFDDITAAFRIPSYAVKDCHIIHFQLLSYVEELTKSNSYKLVNGDNGNYLVLIEH